MESVRNFVDVSFVTTEAAFQKMVRQPRFKEYKTISENVIVVQMRRNSVLLNKYVEMTVLDLSNTHMYSNDMHPISNAKGIKNKYVSKFLTLENYKECFFKWTSRGS